MSYDPDRAKALIEGIEQSRRDFEREISTRTRLLAMLEPRPPQDEILAGIEKSWDRLSDVYARTIHRFERLHGRKPTRRVNKQASAGATSMDDLWKDGWEWEPLAAGAGYRPISNVYNVMWALRECPALAGLIATDESTGKIMLRGPLPLTSDPTFDDDWEMRPLLVADVTAVREYLQFIGLSHCTQEDVGAAIKRVAVENAWRPDVDG